MQALNKEEANKILETLNYDDIKDMTSFSASMLLGGAPDMTERWLRISVLSCLILGKASQGITRETASEILLRALDTVYPPEV